MSVDLPDLVDNRQSGQLAGNCCISIEQFTAIRRVKEATVIPRAIFERVLRAIRGLERDCIH